MKRVKRYELAQLVIIGAVVSMSQTCIVYNVYIGLEQRRPTNPIGGDSNKSQGIGCWSTVNTLQSGLPQNNQVFSHENYR